MDPRRDLSEPTVVEGATPAPGWKPPPSHATRSAPETVVEAGGGQGPGKSEDTVVEGPTTNQGTPRINLVPGAEFLAYRLASPLRVSGAEADLWMLERVSDRRSFVLKLYRLGRQPKPEIVTVLRSLSPEHVVKVIECGRLPDPAYERYYEVQEYVANGSLADLIGKQRLDAPAIREVLRDLTAAIEHLHRARVVHRDVKPSNVLVRAIAPLDLALTDFGISSLLGKPGEPDSELIVTSQSRTPAYSAPEAGARTVEKASDWWSLGVVLLELWLGQNPFAGLSQLAVSRELATRGIWVPSKDKEGKDIPDDWQYLVKGLLTRDPSKRWGPEQIRQWLANKKDIPNFYEYAREAIYPFKPYRFGNKDYFKPAELALAFKDRWDDGVKHFGRGYVAHWVRDELKDTDLINRLADIAEDSQLSAGQRLSALILALNPGAPLYYGGEEVTPEWMSIHPEVAVEILESSLPGWLKHLRGADWLELLRQHRSECQEYLGRSGLDYNQALAERLILTPADAVREQALEQRARCCKSSNRTLDRLVAKPELTDFEAVLFLTCDPGLVYTKKQAWLEECEALTTQLKDTAQAVRKTPTNKALLQECATRLAAIERQVSRRFAELSRPYSLEEDADCAVARSTAVQEAATARRDLQSLVGEWDRQKRIPKLAEAGQYQLAQKFLSQAQRIFDDIDYGKLETEVRRSAEKALVTRAQQGSLAGLAGSLREVQSWFGPDFSRLRKTVHRAVEACLLALLQDGKLEAARAKLLETGRLEEFDRRKVSAALEQEDEAALLRQIRAGDVISARKRLTEAAQTGNGGFARAQAALAERTGFYREAQWECDRLREKQAPRSRMQRWFGMFTGPLANRRLETELACLGRRVREGQALMARCSGTELAREAGPVLDGVEQEVREMTHRLAARRGADWLKAGLFWAMLLLVVVAVALAILLGVLMHVSDPAASARWSEALALRERPAAQNWLTTPHPRPI